MKLVNLTGHTLDLPHLGLVLPAELQAAKTTQKHELMYLIQGVPVYDIKYINIAGLPEPQEDIVYIVSAVTLNAVRDLYPNRTDVVATMKPIKDHTGNTVGCSALRLKG
jgi:hypothetical protein